MKKNKSKEAVVMAIINVTPDSFFEGSRNTSVEDIEVKVRKAIEDGAAILDIGGYSTRPGADEIPEEEEFRRLDLAFKVIRDVAPDMTVSVDTFRSGVVERLNQKWGAFTVNDISAGELDQKMIPLVGKLGLTYIAMHSRGNPQTMQSMTDYDDVTGEVYDFFVAKIEECRAAGIKDVIIDPGFGFAKTVDQNYELLGGMRRLSELGFPVLAGLSRKSMIWRTLGITPNEALNGTSALNWEALRQGAVILRVHDVREAVEITKIFNTFDRNVR